jgi:hypothetical protein
LVFFFGYGVVEVSLAEVAMVHFLVSALASGAGFLFFSAAAGDEVACTGAFLAFVGLIWFFAFAAESFSFRLAFLAVGLVLFAHSAVADVEGRFLAAALFAGSPSVSRGFPSIFSFWVASPAGLASSALVFLFFGHGFFFSGPLFPCGSAEVGV